MPNWLASHDLYDGEPIQQSMFVKSGISDQAGDVEPIGRQSDKQPEAMGRRWSETGSRGHRTRSYEGSSWSEVRRLNGERGMAEFECGGGRKGDTLQEQMN